jgi:hypothetical protein
VKTDLVLPANAEAFPRKYFKAKIARIFAFKKLTWHYAEAFSVDGFAFEQAGLEGVSHTLERLGRPEIRV